MSSCLKRLPILLHILLPGLRLPQIQSLYQGQHQLRHYVQTDTKDFGRLSRQNQFQHG
jgi:hypothetical protein